jgi:hypothetical protein
MLKWLAEGHLRPPQRRVNFLSFFFLSAALTVGNLWACKELWRGIGYVLESHLFLLVSYYINALPTRYNSRRIQNGFINRHYMLPLSETCLVLHLLISDIC